MTHSLLDDHQMADFVRAGCVVTMCEGDALHAEVSDAILRLCADGNPDDAVYNCLPGLEQILTDSQVRGILTSLLGPEYRMQCHRHTHLIAACDGQPAPAQRYHQDGTPRQFKGWNRPWRRWHRPRKLNVFYYPHDVWLERGPTEVVSGSQYWGELPELFRAYAHPLVAPAGTIAFTHYNLWHRGTTNISDQPRVMVKFVFERCAEPTAPSWNAGVEGEPDLETVSNPIEPRPHTRRCVWDWLCCAVSSDEPDSGVDELWQQAANPLESTASIEAAYELALHGKRAVEIVGGDFRGGSEVTRERAALVLSATGRHGVPHLTDALRADDEWQRATGLDILADLGSDAVAEAAKLIDDPSPWVRHNLMAAFEVWGPLARDHRDIAMRALQDDEPFVCFNAMSALANMGNGGNGADSSGLREVLERLRTHPDPKVAWKAGDLLGP